MILIEYYVFPSCPREKQRTSSTQSSCPKEKKDLKVPTKLSQGTPSPIEKGFFPKGKGD
jgi:hypothetical protein